MAYQDVQSVQAVDLIWSHIRNEAEDIIRLEPSLSTFLLSVILHHEHMEKAVIKRLQLCLDCHELPGELIGQALCDALEGEPNIGAAIRADIAAVFDRDPACHRYIEPLLYFKGFQALQTHRFAHVLWNMGRKDLAYFLQSRASQVFQVDMHPAVKLGCGVFFDHATGIVVGETAIIGDDVSVMQDVTLGGTGKANEDRHPKIRHGVLIGAGAKVLGNIEIGPCSRVAAGSVVLKAVPRNKTVAGVPAKIVGDAPCPEPSRAMDHILLEYDAGI